MYRKTTACASAHFGSPNGPDAPAALTESEKVAPEGQTPDRRCGVHAEKDQVRTFRSGHRVRIRQEFAQGTPHPCSVVSITPDCERRMRVFNLPQKSHLCHDTNMSHLSHLDSIDAGATTGGQLRPK